MSLLIELLAFFIPFLFHRAEENVSILSQDIKNIKESNRLAAEENLQSLQTENYSLRSALSKATIE